MKKVAIFGASGMTGICTVDSALNKGLKVRVLLRDPARLPEKYHHLVEIIRGDVLVEKDVENTVEGQHGVVVVLGTRNDLGPTTVMSEGLKNIVSAMKKANVETISVCLSVLLFDDPKEVRPKYKDITEEHQRMFDHIKQQDMLKWIAVMPPHINNTFSSSPYVVRHGSSPGRFISKCDLGEFLVESLDKPEHYQQVCGLANTA